MPVNMSANLPRQYLRAASSVADAVVDDDSARLRFAVVGGATAPVALTDCLRLSETGGGDVEDIILCFILVNETVVRRAWAPPPAVATFFSLPPSSSSESDDEGTAMRLLVFARCGGRE